MVATVKLRVRAADGVTSTLFATADDAVPTTAPILIVRPALGVRASYYAPLFDTFAPHGVRVVTADLRGHGRSSVRPSRTADFGYREILELDWPADGAAVRRRFPGAPVFFLGHSMGGQLAFLYAAARPEEVRGVLAIATCSIWWRAYGPTALPILVLTRLARALAATWGTFPGHRIGFGGREARGVIRDWAHQACTGRYEPAGSSVPYEARLAGSTVPGLILTLAGDRFAPPGAAAHLAGKAPPGVIVHRHLTTPRLPNAHFRWVPRCEALLPEILPWLRANA